MREIILIIAFLSVTIYTRAQGRDFEDGFIVNQKGDTIKGLVKDRTSGSFMELYKRIRFKPYNGKGRKKYSADQIMSYGYNNTIYESISLVEETEFLKFRYRIVNGNDRVFLRLIERSHKLSYYHMEYIHDDNNFLDFVPLFHREGSFEMVRVTQGILGLKKKRLSEYFSDCQDLISAIESKNITEISEVFDYYVNTCKEPN